MGKTKVINVVLSLVIAFLVQGCTVKAVGDPKRPITINAHITVDVKGLEKTASNIEDYVSGESATPVPSKTQGGN